MPQFVQKFLHHSRKKMQCVYMYMHVNVIEKHVHYIVIGLLHVNTKSKLCPIQIVAPTKLQGL
jgi:hypothetical protein